jgi:hypothetical protein
LLSFKPAFLVLTSVKQRHFMSTIAIYGCYASYEQVTSVLNIEKNPGLTNILSPQVESSFPWLIYI